MAAKRFEGRSGRGVVPDDLEDDDPAGDAEDDVDGAPAPDAEKAQATDQAMAEARDDDEDVADDHDDHGDDDAEDDEDEHDAEGDGDDGDGEADEADAKADHDDTAAEAGDDNPEDDEDEHDAEGDGDDDDGEADEADAEADHGDDDDDAADEATADADLEAGWDELVASAPHPPLENDQFSLLELGALTIVAFLLILLPLGAIVLPDLVLDDFLDPYVLDPIRGDASDGDEGYNVVNTTGYTAVLGLAVIAIAALMRRYGAPADNRMLLAFLPWVAWASVVRVLEDAELFAEAVRPLFISPILHFHITGWILVTWALGAGLARLGWLAPAGDVEFSGTTRRRQPWLELSVAALLLFQWWWLLLPAHEVHIDFGVTGPWIGFVLLVAVLTASWYLLDADTPPLALAMGTTGAGSVALALGYWLQFLWTPWHSTDGTTLWPVILVLGLPALVCYGLWWLGREAAADLAAKGLEGGVLPAGASLRDWQEWSPKGGASPTWVERLIGGGSPETHDPPHFAEHPKHATLEGTSPRALLAHPLLLVAVFGQLCDGIATWMGVDFFEYGEKHVLGRTIMEYGDVLWHGAWLFLLAKVAIVAMLVWVFTGVRFEQRHLHLRMLIVLALLVVGLAPGLRDVGRLMLGV